MLSIQGVEVHVEGDGAETIVMVHGWPDTYRLWDAQVHFLKDRFRCVRFTLPGFERTHSSRTRTLDELCGFLLEVIRKVAPDRKVILMLHDWGCIFGYQFYLRHPDVVSRIVGVDIGDVKSLVKAISAPEKFGVLAYQMWLAIAWKIGGRFGDWMTRWMARVAKCPSERGPIGSHMNYPYFMTWFGGKQAYPRHSRRFDPKCPMLFVYGRRKPIRFHARVWAEALAAKRGNQVVEFETGHWVMLEEPARFNQVVGNWLKG